MLFAGNIFFYNLHDVTTSIAYYGFKSACNWFEKFDFIKKTRW